MDWDCKSSVFNVKNNLRQVLFPSCRLLLYIKLFFFMCIQIMRYLLFIYYLYYHSFSKIVQLLVSKIFRNLF